MTKERNNEKASEGNELRSKLSKLSISKNQMPAISTAEFYYGLELNAIENLAVISRSSKSASPKKREKPKKKKADERKIAKLETIEGKFKNLTVTIQNDQCKKNKAPKNQVQNGDDSKETKNLVEQLKMLQQGRMTSESVMKSHNIKELKVPKMKKREEKKRDEIVALNRKIQEKIAKQIKPKLKSIMNEKPLNGMIEKKRTISESSSSNNSAYPPKIKISSINSNSSLPIQKTKIVGTASNEVEIYRYSFEQLYQLQQYSTWQLVPKLQKLNICRTKLKELDEFLMTLLEMPDNERSEMILKKAEERMFIKRKGFNDYTYLSPQFSTVDERPRKLEVKSPRVKEDKQKKDIDYVDRFRLIANNDEELNKLIYQHEFLYLFENELKDQDLKNLTHADIVQLLLDNNQAYILEGEIRINQRNNQEAYVTHKRGMKDVCINKVILRKHAFQGDYVRVLVKKDSSNELENDLLDTSNNPLDESTGTVLDEDLVETSPDISENRNFGCVLEILEQRHSRRVIGTFAPFLNVKKNRRYLMVNVRDPKVPNVRVNIRSGLPTDIELNEKLLLTVEITDWSHDQPQGKVVSILGNKGQLKTENVAILQQNNLNPVPFEQKIIDELPKEPFEIPAKEFEYREDLRKKCIFSIDPESARDLDDALSCEILPNGNLEIGVHISDVSYFVKENSDLDNIVKEKATTIYLVDTVYHMLPEQLCLLCSLLPGSDKLAYSVFFEMDPETAEIFNTRYTRSIVNSCAKLSYDHAQMVIEKKDQNWEDLKTEFPEIHNGFTVDHIADVIVKLQKLAIVMRCNRKSNGALKIDQPKLSFKFAKDDQRFEAPVDFSKYDIKDSNRLIEEFMLLANIYVAKFIYEKFPDISLLRHHDVPNENALKKLTKILNKQNIQLDTSSSAALSKSMENLIIFAKYPNAMSATINHMVSKTMQRAKYFCSFIAESPEAFWHYALSTPMYTHFTSPIRRYADILVHRVLNAALNYEAIPSRTPDEVQEMAEICNAQKYSAKLAGDDSSNLYFMHFIKSLKSKTMLAGVVGIYEFNLEVVLIDTGHLVKVYYKNLQQNDDIIIKTFTDSSPPFVSFHLPKLQVSMKVEFGMEILVQVEVLNDKLIVNKIFYK